MIEIKTEIDEYSNTVEVLSITALEENRLPAKYLAEYPHCFLPKFSNNKTLVVRKNPNWKSKIEIGVTYSREYINKHLKVIRQAGERLALINSRTRKKTYRI